MSESQAKGEGLAKVSGVVGDWLGRAVRKICDRSPRGVPGRIGHHYVRGMETALPDYSERLAWIGAEPSGRTAHLVAAHLDLHHTDTKLVLEP